MSEITCQPGVARLLRLPTRNSDGTPANPSSQTITWYKTGGGSQTLTPTNVATGWYTIDLAGLTAAIGDTGDLVHTATTDATGTAVVARLRFDATVSSRLAPATAGRTLAVDAAGNAFADVRLVVGDFAAASGMLSLGTQYNDFEYVPANVFRWNGEAVGAAPDTTTLLVRVPDVLTTATQDTTDNENLLAYLQQLPGLTRVELNTNGVKLNSAAILGGGGSLFRVADYTAPNNAGIGTIIGHVAKIGTDNADSPRMIEAATDAGSAATNSLTAATQAAAANAKAQLIGTPAVASQADVQASGGGNRTVVLETKTVQ